MADISIVIQGQATAAASAVDTLIGKLNQLSSALDNIANKARSSFSGIGKMDGSNMGDLESRLSSIEDRLDALERASSGVTTSMKETTTTIERAGTVASKSGGFFSKLGSSFARIAFYRFLRTVLKEITQGFKEGMENAYNYSKIVGGPLAAAFDKVKSAGGQMKNQLGAALGTLVQQLQPVINAAISMLTRLAQILTQIFSLFGGSGTYLKATAGNVEDVGNAAGGAGKKIKGLLAAWDELTVIGQEKSGGGGGSKVDDYASMFENAPIEGWLKQAFDASGIPESIERIKKSWNELVEAVKNGDFEFGINTFVLDPLRTVIDTLDGILMLLRGIMSGDLWLVGFSIVKLAFDSIINTVVIPFTRTIDAVFGTNLTEKVLAFKNNVDDALANAADPSVTNPLKERIFKPFNDAWEKIKGVWDKVTGWFSNLFHGLGQILRAAWQVWWGQHRTSVLSALNWIVTNFLEPVVTFFATALDAIVLPIRIAWWGLKSLGAEVINWLIDNVFNPIIAWINKIGPIAAKMLGETWTNVESIGKVSVESFDEMMSKSSQASEFVKKSFDGIHEYLNKELSATPTVTYSYQNAPSGVSATNRYNVQMFAEGGFVTSGQLFVAREAGPEMVGSIGSHTAVANNDQIVAGIASGVREAESEQNALLRQQNSILAQLLSKELTISPSAALGQVVARSNALYARS